MKTMFKIVDFATNCPKCKYKGVDENDDPCFYCLSQTVNVFTDKPVKYEEAKNENK